MYDDPIVEEVQRIREAYSASMGHDLSKMLEDFRSREGKDGREVISRASKLEQTPIIEFAPDAENSQAESCSPTSPLVSDRPHSPSDSGIDPRYEDPIVEEVHRIREAYSASMDHDLGKIVADIMSRQGKDGREVVSRRPNNLRPLTPLPVNKALTDATVSVTNSPPPAASK